MQLNLASALILVAENIKIFLFNIVVLKPINVEISVMGSVSRYNSTNQLHTTTKVYTPTLLINLDTTHG